MLAELFRRRVFSAPDDIGQVVPGPIQVFAGADAPHAEPSITL
jgi:hypothetical protein